jgi:hypothetical protein
MPPEAAVITWFLTWVHTWVHTNVMPLKIAGFLLLLAGWLLVLAALAMLPEGVARNAFIAAGAGVEGLGLVLAGRGHRVPDRK